MKRFDLKNMNVIELEKEDSFGNYGGILFELAVAFAVIGIQTIMDEPERVLNGFLDALS